METPVLRTKIYDRVSIARSAITSGILQSNIQSNGERIGLHLLGRDKSEPTRKALEIKYGLVLNHFNVMADRGSKDSRMFAKNGLVY